MANEKLNIQESLKILEKTGVLNPDLSMKTVMEAAKQMEGIEGDLAKKGWSALIYTNFVIASGIAELDELVKVDKPVKVDKRL